jgi:pyruvate/2-oxoglutarate/acetoin dehydrogenase E1 component
MLTRDPVLIIEDHRLWPARSQRPAAGFDHVIPLRSARTVRTGGQVTVLAWSHALARVTSIADRLAESGIAAEVIDPRWLDWDGFDRDALLRSVERTGALVIVEDATFSHSIGGQVIDRLLPDLFPRLRSAPTRVTGADVPTPVSLPLETVALLRDEDIEASIVAAAAAGRGAHARPAGVA